MDQITATTHAQSSMIEPMVALLVIATTVGILAHRARLPYTVLLMLVGIALNSINTQGKHLAELADQLIAINHKIDSSGVNIARAPEEGLLSKRLEELNKEQDKKTQSILKASQHKENIKSFLREAVLIRVVDGYRK